MESTSTYNKINYFNFGIIKMLRFSLNVHLSFLRNIYIIGLSETEKLSSSFASITGDITNLYAMIVTQVHPVLLLKDLTNDL